MDIHQLKLFLAVIESPSMTRAAEKMRLSLGAVSLQLRKFRLLIFSGSSTAEATESSYRELVASYQ
jgi:hypothetical protein